MGLNYLHERLQVSLSRRLGRAPRIWRDRKLRGNDVFDDEIKQTLANAAIFLPVMSPRYLESTSCRAEVQDFSRLAKQQGRVRIGSKHRVFKVVITDLPLAAHPEEWQGLLGYAFYEKDPASGRVREFDHLLIGEERDKRYWDRFEDLASDIKETLDFLRDDAQPRPQAAQDRAPTAAAGSGAMIYVAETTSDLSTDRDNIRRELQQHGCQVLPDQPLPMNARALEQAVRADLRKTRLSIHLVGAHYGVIPEMERNRSSMRMQLDLAAERCGDATFSRLIWMPIGLSSEDERQQALIDELQRSAQAGSDLLQTNLEELKTCTHAKLAPQPKPATQADGDEGLPRVYLLCDREDYDDTKSIEDFLSDRGVVVLPPPIEGDETLISQYHKESLQACDAFREPGTAR